MKKKKDMINVRFSRFIEFYRIISNRLKSQIDLKRNYVALTTFRAIKLRALPCKQRSSHGLFTVYKIC